MKCIEILFIAYYIKMKDEKHARDACKGFHFIENCGAEIKNII